MAIQALVMLTALSHDGPFLGTSGQKHVQSLDLSLRLKYSYMSPDTYHSAQILD